MSFSLSPKNYLPTLASTGLKSNLTCCATVLIFRASFLVDGWGVSGKKTDDNTFAWQRLLKCQADDCTRISPVSVSIVKAFK